MDLFLFHTINNLALKYAWLDALGIFFALWAIALLALWYGLAVIFSRDKQKVFKLLLVLFILALVYLVDYIISEWWFEARPFVAREVNLLISKSAGSKSFPSDHAALAFALAVGLLRWRRSWWWALLVAAAVALSRVFVGVHYVHDVAAGAVIGVVVAWSILRFSERWFMVDKN